MNQPSRTGVPAAVWLLASLFLTTVLYWPGLGGPLVLDDETNLAVLQSWALGEETLQHVLSGGNSGAFGRPVSMASFALSTYLGGYTPFAFKLGNLLAHLACGVLVFYLIRSISRRDPRLEVHAVTVAALVAALWLLHPLQTSTVFYAVQRMAQLSTLFMLLGLMLYMFVRTRLMTGEDRVALGGLFVGIPLLTGVGFLAKENALLLPALCLVLEWGAFAGTVRRRAVKAFFFLYLLLPAVLGLLWFLLEPARLMGGYFRRDFDWQERLLTQARVLCDYLWKIVAPDPPSMGIFTDDFPVSTGLFSPPTTIVAVLLLCAITLCALRFRHRFPALFIGWGIFVVGHAIESTFLPLEMYFEHRNYLPMLGILYALVALAVVAATTFRSDRIRPTHAGMALAAGVLALYAFGIHGRARVWSDDLLIAEAGVDAHPESLRAQMALVTAALRHNDGRRAAAVLQAMTKSANPRVRVQGNLVRINIDCALKRQANPDDLAAAQRAATNFITQDEAETFRLLYGTTSVKCSGIDDASLGRTVERFLDQADKQPDWLAEKAQLAHVGALFYGRAQDWPNALSLAKRAWQPGMSPAAAVILIQAQLGVGDTEGAERTWEEARARIDPLNPEDVAGLRWLAGQIQAAKDQAVAQ